MTDEEKLQDELRFAAQIADRLLAKAQDGTKLLSITRNYPVRFAAFEYGFNVACGAFCALALMVAMTSLVSYIWKALS